MAGSGSPLSGKGELKGALASRGHMAQSTALLRIGTRGSPLALVQARTVRARLAAATGVGEEAYAGAVEASRVPPEWHAWLHYTTDAPLLERARYPWEKPHQANATGTPESYRPPGHDYQGGKRARATGDYEAWTPGS